MSPHSDYLEELALDKFAPYLSVSNIFNKALQHNIQLSEETLEQHPAYISMRKNNATKAAALKRRPKAKNQNAPRRNFGPVSVTLNNPSKASKTMALDSALLRPSKIDHGQAVAGRVPRNIAPVGLSPAAMQYAVALTNPWSPLADMASIPIGNGRGTQKATSFNRFDITVGDSGVGWLIVAPTVCNDVQFAYVTGALYAGTTAVPYAIGSSYTFNTGVTGITATNLPYTAAQLKAPYNTEGVASTGVYGRVVSAGITAWYTGTTLNQGGLVYCFSDPDHMSVVGQSVALLGARKETEISNVSRMKCYLSDYPLTESECNFDRTDQYQAATGGGTRVSNVVPPLAPFASGFGVGPDSAGTTTFIDTTFQPTMIIMVTGVKGNTVHVELCQHVEYQGPASEGKLTPSSVDRIGFDKVQAAMGLAVTKRNARNGDDLGTLFLESLSFNEASARPVPTNAMVKAILM